MCLRIHTLFIAFGFFSLAVSGQPQSSVTRNRTCNTPVPGSEWDQWFNGLVKEQRQISSRQKRSASYKIPVVVHVIHGGEAKGVYPNLSQEQVLSQIKALNDDFSGNGAGSNDVPAVFADDIANCNITFSMAQLDPSGLPLKEPGINRVDWHNFGSEANPDEPSSSAEFQQYFDDVMKPATIWDPTRYFNIWVSDVKSTLDLLGYSTFPTGTGLNGIFNGNGTATSDGVWIWAGAFGTTGQLHKQYDMGRTATHEIGHWLGLRHIWGDVSCGDDFCDDTPKQQGMNLGCPAFPKISCSNGPSGEMFMNFMDYCDDKCLNMFSWDQMMRMQTAMEKGEFRKNLTASSATLCDLPETQPNAVFSVSATACTNTFLPVQNLTTGLPAPDFTWEVLPATGVDLGFASGTGDPVLIFTTPGNYDIKVTAANSAGMSTHVRMVSVTDCGIPAATTETGKKPGWTIFPNPGSGVFRVAGHGPAPVIIRVHDGLGRIAFEKKIAGEGDAELDLAALPDGIYFAEMEHQRHREVRKLVIAR